MAPRKTTTKTASSKPRKPARLARQVKPLIERKLSTPLKGRKAVFAGKVFVLSGEFPNQHGVMEGWITHHGGRVDKVVTDETTHLVCTMDNFKNKVSDGMHL
jgi:NAD-dependent DNA ligase